MRAVPEDEEGIDIAHLRREIQKSEDDAQAKGNSSPRFKPHRERAKVYKHIMYCVPSFSNPSSRTMSLRRRQELVLLAREFDMLVICDDVYDMLQWPAKDDESHVANLETQLEATEAAHLPRLVDVDRELSGGAERVGADGFGNAISNGTVSKLAGPGLRTGWCEGTAKFTYGLSQWCVSPTPCKIGVPGEWYLHRKMQSHLRVQFTTVVVAQLHPTFIQIMS